MVLAALVVANGVLTDSQVMDKSCVAAGISSAVSCLEASLNSPLPVDVSRKIRIRSAISGCLTTVRVLNAVGFWEELGFLVGIMSFTLVANYVISKLQSCLFSISINRVQGGSL